MKSIKIIIALTLLFALSSLTLTRKVKSHKKTKVVKIKEGLTNGEVKNGNIYRMAGINLTLKGKSYDEDKRGPSLEFNPKSLDNCDCGIKFSKWKSVPTGDHAKCIVKKGESYYLLWKYQRDTAKYDDPYSFKNISTNVNCEGVIGTIKMLFPWYRWSDAVSNNKMSSMTNKIIKCKNEFDIKYEKAKLDVSTYASKLINNNNLLKSSDNMEQQVENLKSANEKLEEELKALSEEIGTIQIDLESLTTESDKLSLILEDEKKKLNNITKDLEVVEANIIKTEESNNSENIDFDSYKEAEEKAAEALSSSVSKLSELVDSKKDKINSIIELSKSYDTVAVAKILDSIKTF